MTKSQKINIARQIYATNYKGKSKEHWCFRKEH